MGLLDNILAAPQKTEADFYTPKITEKDYNKTSALVHCDICGKEFQGQAWMLKSRKSINCPGCWGAERRKDEFER